MLSFQLSQLVSMSSKNSSKANNIPNHLLPFIPEWVTSFYFAKLSMAREAIIGMAIIRFSGAPLNSKEGEWLQYDFALVLADVYFWEYHKGYHHFRLKNKNINTNEVGTTATYEWNILFKNTSLDVFSMKLWQ